ncbi:MAG: hypothetical protein KatS3mg057_1665 [Herpetosiphonaceae bacterium]|nr:MAG: hypothetical protein KatS3mg057_1665 [Herpetosiphonaceae bacterium]
MPRPSRPLRRRRAILALLLLAAAALLPTRPRRGQQSYLLHPLLPRNRP